MAIVQISEGSKIISPNTQTVYRLIKAVGHGSYGTVYKSKPGSSLKFVAIKIIDVSGMGDEVDTILQEVSLTQRAYEFSDGRCPRCIEAFALCLPGAKSNRTKKYIVIVMDYIDGICLSELLLNDKPLCEVMATYVLYEIAAALKGLHAHGMIHRDIKSSNVMLSKDGGVFVCDFGVSKILGDHCASTSTMNGTPLWMAPEVIKEMSYNQSADIFSLGITAVELVIGHPPIPDRSEDDEGLMHQLRCKRTKPNLDKGIFTRFYRNFIVDKCLEIIPTKRCSAQDIVAAIYSEYNAVSITDINGRTPNLKMGSYDPKISLIRLVNDNS